MGHQHRHYPKCWSCNRTFPHYLMVEAGRTKDGRKIHFCIPCQEKHLKEKSEGVS